MRFAVLFLVLGIVLSSAHAVQADIVDDCDQSADHDLSIVGCTAMIDTGLYAGTSLAKIYTNRGFSYTKLGEYTHAIEDYDRAIRLDPKLALPYFNRGNVYFRLGEYERAIENYDQATRLNPKYIKAYTERGRANFQLGKYKRAIKDLDRAVSLDPEYSRAYTARGFVYQVLGEANRAIRDWERGIELEGESRIRSWQKALWKTGRYFGLIGGTYGPATKAALVACAHDPEC